MDNITNVRCGPMPDSAGFIKTFRMYYVQNNVEKNWDLAMEDDTVAVVVYNKTTDKLIFVKRFRPVVLYDAITQLESKLDNEDKVVQYPAELGFTLELCRRTVDKNLQLNENAQQEIERICGYRISLDRIEQAMTYRSDVGAAGAEETLFYCEVMDEDKITNATAADGGESKDKHAGIVEMSTEEARRTVEQVENARSPPSFLMGVFWFLRNKSVAKH